VGRREHKFVQSDNWGEQMRFRLFFTALLLGFLLACARSAHAQSHDGAVYVASNEPTGNRVLQFLRDEDGDLTPAGSFQTGGLGTGGGLGNQGGLILTDNGQWLLVVNAGSDDISVFAVDSDEKSLNVADRKPSGGRRPVSIAVDRGLVYILNAGGAVGAADNVSGFRLTAHGQLVPIPDSTRPLSAPITGPAQIHFASNGEAVVVTEKNTNGIDVFHVNRSGSISSSQTFNSTGVTPFGFAVTLRNTVLVSNAGGGANASSLTSYRLEDGAFNVLAGPIPTNQTAACWVVATHSGRFAYTTNTGSGSVSGYSITTAGTPTLLNTDGITGVTGKGPIDADLSFGDRFLYVLNSGDHSISAFSVRGDGSLGALPTTTGLPAGANGLAAR